MAGFPIHGDLALSEDERYLVLGQGVEEYADRLRAALQIFQGTWRYDQRVGIRYLGEILEKPASVGLDLLRAEFYRVIDETPGTRRVVSVSASYDSAERTVNVAWTARSIYGDLVSEVTVIA